MKSLWISRFGLTALAALFLVPAQAAEEPARVVSFSPQGTVKNVRQVQARFSQPMVPFGDPRSVADPFEIDCPGEAGQSRWADPKNWIYDFERDLPAGVLCRFQLKPDLKALDGRALTGRRTFEFSTGGPSILRSTPWEGSSGIDENQIFVLQLDAVPDLDSVRSHVHFSVAGLVDRVGVVFVEGEEREQILNSLYPYRDSTAGDDVLLLKARQSFPQDAGVRLVWGVGVATKNGVGTTETQTLAFQTRPAFTARFECQRENAESPCVPITAMRIEFTSAVSIEDASKISLKSGAREWKPEAPEDDGENFTYQATFKGPFPESTVFTVHLPPGVKDDAGRPLANQDRFPLTVRTDEYPPLAKFAADFGILELNADPALPLTLRSVEPELQGTLLRSGTSGVSGQVRRFSGGDLAEIGKWMDKVRRRSREDRGVSIFADETTVRGEVRRFTVPKPNGGKAFEVVGLPLPKPGFYVVELESEILGTSLLGQPRTMFVPAAALVTNLGVHFKWGLESSLVWVTRLDNAEPVAGTALQVWNCEGTMLAEATTDVQGVARFADLPPRGDAPYCSWSEFGDGLLVTARHGEDFSFVHSAWTDGIEGWRFQLPVEWDSALITARTVFDRPLFRAGETVHMKHFIRRRTTSGFAPVAAGELPNFVEIRHDGSGKSEKQPLKFDASGVAESEWNIPVAANLGGYSVSFLRLEKDETQASYDSGSFRVEEYRVPLMRGAVRPPSEPLVSPSAVTFDLSAGYLAGGPANGLPAVFRSQVQPSYGRSVADFEGFVFANGGVKEEVVRYGEESEGATAQPVRRQELNLDASGAARVTVGDLPKLDTPMQILAELEFKDPNGEVQTISNRVPLWPYDRLIGIKPDSWTLSQDSLKFQVAVVDLEDRPVGQAAVQVELFVSDTYSHRKRLVGGFYAYEHIRETKRQGVICEGQTNAKGILECDVKSPLSGQLILAASTVDTQGRPSSANHSVWVAGERDWWFAVADDDRMDVIPERPRYEPGETATFQVRMPFREATALVSIEREGIGETWIRKLSGKSPVIEVPIARGYAPNVFVSVLAVRGRSGEVQPTALVDLGKPAFKLGVAEISVGWKEHELKVRVESEREVYRVRETAQIHIQVDCADGAALPAGSEVAVAAVDEGLLELLPNASWRLLAGMMGRRGYGVETSTAQMQVVGKRHFGLKALPQGGGGGQQTTRELFDTLLFWKARVKLDAEGKASLEIPLNDSLTSFRIVAVANGGVDRFGTGDTTIRSTQDLQIFSSVPPLVRQGDTFQAGFKIRNASERKIRVRLNADIQPLRSRWKEQRLQLDPGEARDVFWEVSVPAGLDALTYEIEARDEVGFSDRLRVTQKVAPSVPVRTFQATLTQLEPDFQIPVALPADAEPERGGVRLNLSPSLLAGLDSVRRYMADYPYSCFEQKTSKAIASGDPDAWNRLMGQISSYQDGDGLLKYFPNSRLGSEVLTSYVVSVAHERGWEIPPDNLEPMLQGLEGFVEGRVYRGSSMPTADLALRKLGAIEALSRHGRAQGRQLSSIEILPNLWPTSGVIDWLNILQRVEDVPDRDLRRESALQILRSRLNFQGTVMSFSTDASDGLWWLMVSNDVNAVRMTLSLLEAGEWREDIPRVIVGAFSRQRRGYWDLTTANAWGVLAAEKFAKAFESEPVGGVTEAALSGKSESLDWRSARQGGELEFPWPERRTDLKVSHEGSGRPWLSLESRAAIPLKEAFSSGYAIRKTVTPIERKNPAFWSVGDIVRVRLEIEAQTDMTWVVVQDPIPAGSSVLGTGLGRDSSLATQGERREGWVWPAFEERSFEAFRAYYEYVPKGSWTVEYTLRISNSGVFKLPTTRVEALYRPELFGEVPNSDFSVRP